MEHLMEFSTFCNICFNKTSLRKIEETEHLTKILTIFIENKIVIKEQDIYLCLKCCEKMESYNEFKEMCLRNFIDFRIEYFELKKKLEIMNDPNVERKLRSFIETKVYGDNGIINLDACEDPVKDNRHVQESERTLTEKQAGKNDYNYNFESVDCKIEQVDYEETEEYKLHTELDLEDNTNNFVLPIPVEHVKIESYIEEDMTAIESSRNITLLNESKPTEPYKTKESCDTTNKVIQQKENESVKILNKNSQSTNKELPDVVCHICRKTFSTTGNLSKHMRLHTGEKPYACTICNKSFRESSALKIHTTIHTGEKQYACNMCSKTFATRSHLRDHQLIHTGERRHICNVCNKGYYFSNQLKKHMIIHTEENPYTCLICNKAFGRSLDLKQHERVHTGEKPYACSMCDKTFRCSSYLKLHEPVHTGEKPYTCEICQKSFPDRSNLKRHIRVHTGEKPFECTECNKRFADRSNYKTHKLIHTGEKPHTCSVCNKSFTQLSALRVHERTHTGVKPYGCDICTKRFRRKWDLRSHRKKPCALNIVEIKVPEQPEET